MFSEKKRIIRILVIAVCSAICIACASYFVWDFINRNNSTLPPSEVISEIEYNEEQEVIVPVDFDELKSKNEDIYAWINIPNQDDPENPIIDYPILQSGEGKERDFYLSHDVTGKKSSYGAIYTQDYNTKDFNDFNTVIYGHNMLNKTMFGKLKSYRDKSFFEKNNIIYVYMPKRILKYQIFGAYVFDDRHILLNYDFDSETQREAYLNEVFSRKNLYSNFDDSLTVGVGDNIITLSTCTSKDSERYLVQGVLIDDSAHRESD